jgi:hypothetical protein
MATLAQKLADKGRRPDQLSGTPRAGFIDRWIFVFMAAWFIAITLTGFIPDSLAKIAAVEAGERPPFPLLLHMHAVLMGTFLLLLLAQTMLMATGRCELHRRLGLAAFVLAPALVIVGFMLVPTMYQQAWNAAQAAPPGALRERLQELALRSNGKLVQLRIGFLFPLLLIIGLRARGRDAGLHQRMMFLATAMALSAAIDRITWLPTTKPMSPLSSDLYTLLAVAPMFVWDIIRNRRVHEAYWIWLAVNLPFAVAVYSLWGTESWHSMAQLLMVL